MIELLGLFFFKCKLLSFPLERMCYFALPPTICECLFLHPSKRQHLKNFYRIAFGPFLFFSPTRYHYHSLAITFHKFVDSNSVSHFLFHFYQVSKEVLPTWGKGIIEWTGDLNSELPWIPVSLMPCTNHLPFLRDNFLNSKLDIIVHLSFFIGWLFKGQIGHSWKVCLNILCLVASYCHIVKISEHKSILIF